MRLKLRVGFRLVPKTEKTSKININQYKLCVICTKEAHLKDKQLTDEKQTLKKTSNMLEYIMYLVQIDCPLVA